MERDAFDYAIARRLAGGELDDELVSSFAAGQRPVAEYIRDLDVCSHGICVDYGVNLDDFGPFFQGLFAGGSVIRKITGFPWGIIDPKAYRIQVALDVRAEREL